jgi:putative heme transporter
MTGHDPRPTPSPGADGDGLARVWRAGRTAWAVLGVLLLLAVAGYVAALLPLVVVPVVLALFPATLLVPVAGWLKRRGVPAALAALASIVAGILLIGGVIGAMVPLVAAELPDLAEAAGEGVGELERFLDDEPFGLEVGGLDDLLETAREQLPETGQLAGQALGAAVVAFETVAGLLLVIVLLFFYLKDGSRLADGLATLAPRHRRRRVRGAMQSAWETLGAYFRGQLLVALVDAVVIGLGLVLLGVPLALPLAVLIFFGGLFPIVGAVLTGALAVLVALADGGLVIALVVLGLVLAVQQLESNVLEPIILGRAIDLHPVVVLLSITAGAMLLGILGAFLAVPVAAIVARTLREARDDEPGDDRDGDAPARGDAAPDDVAAVPARDDGREQRSPRAG